MKQQKQSRVNYDEQFKIRVRRNASIKHEHIKLNIVLALLEKYKKQLYWIRIYTEYPLTSNNKTKITDVYFENIKTNEIICYEIQKTISEKWATETTKFYDKLERVYFKTDWILINENDFSDDLNLLDEQVREAII